MAETHNLSIKATLDTDGVQSGLDKLKNIKLDDVKLDIDDKALSKLKKSINEISAKGIKLTPTVDLSKVKKDIASVKGKTIVFDAKIDLSNVTKKIAEIEGKKVKVDVVDNVDEVNTKIQQIKGKDVNVNVVTDADLDEILASIDLIKGKSVNTKINPVVDVNAAVALLAKIPKEMPVKIITGLEDPNIAADIVKNIDETFNDIKKRTDLKLPVYVNLEDGEAVARLDEILNENKIQNIEFKPNFNSITQEFNKLINDKLFKKVVISILGDNFQFMQSLRQCVERTANTHLKPLKITADNTIDTRYSITSRDATTTYAPNGNIDSIAVKTLNNSLQNSVITLQPEQAKTIDAESITIDAPKVELSDVKPIKIEPPKPTTPEPPEEPYDNSDHQVLKIKRWKYTMTPFKFDEQLAKDDSSMPIDVQLSQWRKNENQKILNTEGFSLNRQKDIKHAMGDVQREYTKQFEQIYPGVFGGKDPMAKLKKQLESQIEKISEQFQKGEISAKDFADKIKSLDSIDVLRLKSQFAKLGEDLASGKIDKDTFLKKSQDLQNEIQTKSNAKPEDKAAKEAEAKAADVLKKIQNIIQQLTNGEISTKGFTDKLAKIGNQDLESLRKSIFDLVKKFRDGSISTESFNTQLKQLTKKPFIDNSEYTPNMRQGMGLWMGGMLFTQAGQNIGVDYSKGYGTALAGNTLQGIGQGFSTASYVGSVLPMLKPGLSKTAVGATAAGIAGVQALQSIVKSISDFNKAMSQQATQIQSNVSRLKNSLKLEDQGRQFNEDLKYISEGGVNEGSLAAAEKKLASTNRQRDTWKQALASAKNDMTGLAAQLTALKERTENNSSGFNPLIQFFNVGENGMVGAGIRLQRINEELADLQNVVQNVNGHFKKADSESVALQDIIKNLKVLIEEQKRNIRIERNTEATNEQMQIKDDSAKRYQRSIRGYQLERMTGDLLDQKESYASRSKDYFDSLSKKYKEEYENFKKQRQSLRDAIDALQKKMDTETDTAKNAENNRQLVSLKGQFNEATSNMNLAKTQMTSYEGKRNAYEDTTEFLESEKQRRATVQQQIASTLRDLQIRQKGEIINQEIGAVNIDDNMTATDKADYFKGRLNDQRVRMDEYRKKSEELFLKALDETLTPKEQQTMLAKAEEYQNKAGQEQTALEQYKQALTSVQFEMPLKPDMQNVTSLANIGLGMGEKGDLTRLDMQKEYQNQVKEVMNQQKDILKEILDLQKTANDYLAAIKDINSKFE